MPRLRGDGGLRAGGHDGSDAEESASAVAHADDVDAGDDAAGRAALRRVLARKYPRLRYRIADVRTLAGVATDAALEGRVSSCRVARALASGGLFIADDIISADPTVALGQAAKPGVLVVFDDGRSHRSRGR